MRSNNIVAAIVPISCLGWTTVVSGGLANLATGKSSHPTTDKASGIQRPISTAALIAPTGIKSTQGTRARPFISSNSSDMRLNTPNARPSQLISRVLFPGAEAGAAIIYLGRRLLTISSGLPEARTERAVPRPCLALLRVGVAWPPLSPTTPVVSYTTFSPSPSW
jgi:hypothetical protein